MFKTFVTENHPYYVRTMSRVWNNETRSYKRYWSEPIWKEVKDLTKNEFVGIPIPQIEENPFNLDEETCWLLGRYIADGHIRHQKRPHRKNSYQYGVVYSIGNTKIEDFKSKLVKYNPTIHAHTKSCYRAVINSKDLVDFIETHNFGKGAINKNIPNLILNLPIDLAKSFLEGYMSGDGCFSDNKYKATSISEDLILGLQLLVAKIYKTSSNVNLFKRPKTTIIEGRIVNQHDTYSITYDTLIKKQNNSFVDLDNNIIWYPIKNIVNENCTDTVYNLEVENDNSYTANNFIVHNCQDYSVAGKQAGGDKGSGTRSSLMYESIRIIEKIKPKYVVWENVKNLLSKKHKHNFDAYLETMSMLGYNNYYKVLNAKDYGIPQNRERIFTISIRKDIDSNNFKFPEKQELNLKLKDMLDDIVDDKYYLNNYQINMIKSSNYNTTRRRIQEKDYCDTLCARDWKDPKCIQVGNLSGGKWDKMNDCSRRIYSDLGISPTVHTCQGGNTELKVLTSSSYTSVQKDNLVLESENKDTPSNTNFDNIKVIGNYMPSEHDASRIVDSNYIAPTVKENHGTVIATNIGIRIRKLTPLECWRLMGFSDNDFNVAKKALNDTFYKGKDKSNSQLYKQAGNSIVVNVLFEIFKNLFNEKEIL